MEAKQKNGNQIIQQLLVSEEITKFKKKRKKRKSDKEEVEGKGLRSFFQPVRQTEE